MLISLDGVYRARDGFYDNLAFNESYGDKEASGGRGKLTFKPTETTTIDLTVQHEEFRDQADPYIFMPQTNPTPFTVNFDTPGYENTTQDVQSLRIRSEFDSFELMSVTSHRNSSWRYRVDAVQYGASFDPFVALTDSDVRTITQEIRLSSKETADSKIDWSAGLFLAQMKMDFAVGALLSDFATPAIPLSFTETTSLDVAIFGDVVVPLGSNVNIHAGLRYEWADREGENDFAAPLITSATENYSAFLPSIAVIFDPTDNASLYAKYARGFKPGGFNAGRSLTNPLEFEFSAETSNNFELGIKSLLADDRLSIEAAVFYTDFSNYHDFVQLNLSQIGVSNAQKAESYGVELSLSYQFTPEFKAYTNFGYTHAKYNQFVNSFGDFSGNRISFTPEYTATYGLEYGGKEGPYFSAQAETIGRYYLDDGNAASQGAFTRLDLVAGYRWKNFDLSAFADNVTDEDYVIANLDFTGSGFGVGSIGDPVTYGVRLRAEF